MAEAGAAVTRPPFAEVRPPSAFIIVTQPVDAIRRYLGLPATPLSLSPARGPPSSVGGLQAGLHPLALVHHAWFSAPTTTD